jgi:hypothetical protein
MKHWLPLFSMILAVGFTAIGAHAQIPGFVREGLVVTYSGTADNLVGTKKSSSQQITVNTVTSNLDQGTTVTTVSGTTVITTYLSATTVENNDVIDGNKTVNWSCTEKKACDINPPQLGAIAQFWVNTSDPAGSILEAGRVPYTDVTPCPAEVVTSGSKCLNSLGPFPNPNSDRTYYLLLAFDSTGLIQYSRQRFEPFGTFSGDVGEVIYHFQSMLPPQSDGTSIFLQDGTGQPMMVWELNGTDVTDVPNIPKPGAGWYIAGIGDFNGDGNSDILWQSGTALTMWEMGETGRIGQGRITDNGTIINTGPGWQVVGTGDFNRDGNSDILWQQNGSGDIEIWEMNGTERIGHARITNPNPGPGWRAVGTGDFNLDGKADILWQNTSGEVAISLMDGTTVMDTYSIALNPGPSWQAFGAGNFDGTGKTGILFQNQSNGQFLQVSILEMNGTALIPITNGGTIPKPGLSWHVVGVSDYHSDGTADILFQNQNNSEAITVWAVNGTSIMGHFGIPNPSLLLVMGVGE